MCTTFTGRLPPILLITDLIKALMSICTRTLRKDELDLRLRTMLVPLIRMPLMAVSLSDPLYNCHWIRSEDLIANSPSHIVLDKARMEYSYKHPTLLTVVVDAAGASDDHEWRLPTFDPRNEKKYLYKLHTVDIYFWEKEDAELFLNAARALVPEKQMAILDEPAAPAAHHEEMSPVVQQLENVAISDPSYQQGQTRDSRPSASYAADPPLSAVPQPEKVPEKAFSPMAYNPAAPAAPEAIRHREKTPPPEGGAANPLAAAAASDQEQAQGYNQFAPPQVSVFGPPSQPLYFAGPPQAGHAGSPYAPPPPSALSRTQSYPQSVPQHMAYNPQAQYLGQQAPLQSPAFAPPPQYSQASPPAASAPPVGGFSNYQYQQAPAAQLSNEYAVHQQLYRPTEGEQAVKNRPAKPPKGPLQGGAQILDKGVTSFLKKVEKKFG